MGIESAWHRVEPSQWWLSPHLETTEKPLQYGVSFAPLQRLSESGWGCPSQHRRAVRLRLSGRGWWRGASLEWGLEQPETAPRSKVPRGAGTAFGGHVLGSIRKVQVPRPERTGRPPSASKGQKHPVAFSPLAGTLGT